MPPSHADRPRVWANALAVASQFAAVILCFGLGTGFEEATASETGTPAIEPAGYAFIVWSVIYLGSVLYAVYQLRAERRADPLLRRIGWYTASAYLSVAVWLVMARLNLVWLTVACIVWMLASLLPAFFRVARRPHLSWGERACVAVPLGVFAGWVTAATFANTAAALKVSGLLDVGLTEVGWTLVMLTAAGLLGVALTVRARGSVSYGGTLVWAFAGIAVANLHRGPHPAVAAVACGMAVLVVGAVVTTAASGPRHGEEALHA